MDICLNCLKNFEPNANESTVKLSEYKYTCDNCGKLENLVTEFDDYSKEYNNAIDAVNSVLKDYFDFVPLNKAIAVTDVLAEKGVIKLNNLQIIEKLKSENTELYKSINDMATNVAKINEALPKMRADVCNEFAEQLKEYFREKAIETFGDMADSIEYLTIDIEQTEIDIDNILKDFVSKAYDSTTDN